MYKSGEYFYNAAINVENISASFKLLSLLYFLLLYLIFLFFVCFFFFFFSDLQMVQVQKMEKVNLINLSWGTSVRSGNYLFSNTIFNI